MTLKSINNRLKRKDIEHQEQATFIRIVNMQKWKYPGLDMLFSIPNGGQRHIAVAIKLKAEGVRAGVPDLMLAVARGGYHGMFIEMKSGYNKPTVAQACWLERAAKEGYHCVVCYNAVEAWDAVKKYIEEGK